MKGDFHVRFRENLRVKLPWVTRLVASRATSNNAQSFDKLVNIC
jgi:hypothetical protein